MRFVVDPAVWERFPDMRLVVVWADSLDNKSERPELRARLDQSVEQLNGTWSYPNPQSHPRIAPWRAAFKVAGVSGKKFPSSIEALTRRALSGRPISSINPLVDLYNSISLTHLVPAGGWDLDDFRELGEGELRLAMTTGGERFRELGSNRVSAVDGGEVSYLIGVQVVTRHFVWRQSDLGKLTGETTRALLVSEVLREVGEEPGANTTEERAWAVEQDLVAGLRTYFHCAPQSAVLTSGTQPLAIDE